MSKEEVNLLIRADNENPDIIVARARNFAQQLDVENINDINKHRRKQQIVNMQENFSLNEAVNEILASLEEKQEQYIHELKVLCPLDTRIINTQRLVRRKVFCERKAWHQAYTESMLKYFKNDELIPLLELLKLKKPSLLPLAVSFLRDEMENQKKITGQLSRENLISSVKKKLSTISGISHNILYS